MKVNVIIAITLMVVAISLASEEDLSVGNRKFTTKFFKEIIKNKPNQNIIFAPITIQILMAVLTSATTTGGPAIEEIKSVLELPSQRDKIHDQFMNVTKELDKHDDDFKMFNANKIYFGTGCTIANWFKTITRDIYNVDMEIIDFICARPDAADTINKWVALRTNNRIGEFIQHNKIPYATRVLMINAIHLMGKWETPFQPHETTQERFYTPNGRKQVAMMKTIEKSYLYFEDYEAKYLKITLLRDGGAAEMVFVLPHCRPGLDALIQNNLHRALFPHPFSPARVTVALPKFKITNDVPLKPILQNLGVNQIFNNVKLDGYNYYGYVNNRINDVFQKALIEVDESGVTAISATISSSSVDAPQFEVEEFKADHPFLFYIRVAEVIVYTGQVVEP